MDNYVFLWNKITFDLDSILIAEHHFTEMMKTDIDENLRNIFLEKLKIIEIKKIEFNIFFANNKKDNYCCPICLENKTEGILLTCNHLFCEDCIKIQSRYAEQNEIIFSCPLCRCKIHDLYKK